MSNNNSRITSLKENFDIILRGIFSPNVCHILSLYIQDRFRVNDGNVAQIKNTISFV